MHYTRVTLDYLVIQNITKTNIQLLIYEKMEHLILTKILRNQFSNDLLFIHAKYF